MEIIRKTKQYSLNKGTLQADGLFNVSSKNDVSFWFDHEEKNELMKLSNGDFNKRCEQMIKESDY